MLLKKEYIDIKRKADNPGTDYDPNNYDPNDIAKVNSISGIGTTGYYHAVIAQEFKYVDQNCMSQKAVVGNPLVVYAKVDQNGQVLGEGKSVIPPCPPYCDDGPREDMNREAPEFNEKLNNLIRYITDEIKDISQNPDDETKMKRLKELAEDIENELRKISENSQVSS